MSIESLIWLIPLPPILAFFLIVLVTNRSKWLSHTLAILAALTSGALTMYIIAQAVGIEHFCEHPFTSYIVVTFNGGQGLGFATLMQATVIRSDGTKESKSAIKPAINTEIILDGTTRPDRVIVNVSFVDGSTYTVRDVLVPFQNINPTAAY